ncbi:hypothetical protein BDW22DRAFT_1355854 [Trametopsis cervina]|nr:hypothetical protein BDW22DRAFT_1355854 [Trametopsis cervina]
MWWDNDDDMTHPMATCGPATFPSTLFLHDDWTENSRDGADTRVPPELLKVSLYAWAHGSRRFHRGIIAQYFSSKHRSDDEIRSAFQDESDVSAIMRAASTALADEQTINDDLHLISTVLWAVFRSSAAAHNILGSSDPNAPSIIELILAACQRRACMGTLID